MAGHAHHHGVPDAHDEPPLSIARSARAALLGALALVAVATVVGVVLLWPDRSALQALQAASPYAAPGVTFPDARVDSVAPACPVQAGTPTDPGAISEGTGAGCGTATVTVTEGDSQGRQVQVQLPAEVTASGLGAGDTVQLVRTPAASGPVAFQYSTTERRPPLLWLALGFAVLVVLVARWRGALALVSLGFAAVAVWEFTLPALLTGGSGTGVALTTAAAIMFVVLYLTHGLSLRTSAALAGTLAGLGATALLGLVAIHGAQLTGVADETGGFISSAAPTLDFRGVLSCGIVLAGLGVLNDVTITQASAVWELRAASPDLTRRSLFVRAMRIGRDHIASTIYTLAFAYAGAALITLLLLQLYDRSPWQLLSTEELAEEVARTLTSSIGLVLAVPLTTLVAVVVVGTSTAVEPGADPGSAPGRRRAPGSRLLPGRRDPDWDLAEEARTSHRRERGRRGGH